MKYVVFLLDGAADYPLEELDGKTPLEYARTPNIDELCKNAELGTYLTLPEPFPTSSDVANMSILGWDLSKGYTGRGPIEMYGAGYEMKDDEIAFRLNLITVKDDKIFDYSAGHISETEASTLINFLNEKLGNSYTTFLKGVSYRNLLVLKGDEFSADVLYEKPDSSHGEEWKKILLKGNSEKGKKTAEYLNSLTYKSYDLLINHPVNLNRIKEGKNPANLIWPWSGGKKPEIPSFYENFKKKGGIISAVDVILGLGKLGKMIAIKPEGATGYIDTYYEGKANAALEILKDNDFVYIHIEGIDECSHLGDLNNKIKAIEDCDRRLIGHFLDNYYKIFNEDIRIMILPDHPVPVKLRKHTRDLVPFLIYDKNIIKNNNYLLYNEKNALKGKYLNLKGRELMDLLFKNGNI